MYVFIFSELIGPDNTPYAGGIFKLDIEIPDRSVVAYCRIQKNIIKINLF